MVPQAIQHALAVGYDQHRSHFHLAVLQCSLKHHSRGSITELMARHVRNAVSESVVISLLGKPHRRLWKTGGQPLKYRIYDPVVGAYIGSVTHFVDSATGIVTIREHL